MANCTQYQQEIERLEQEIVDANQAYSKIPNPTRAEIMSHAHQISRLEADIKREQEKLRNCQNGLPLPGRSYTTQGRVTYLRVHTGAGFGPANDHLDAEVIFEVDSHPDRAFGFKLREDSTRPASEGMLSLLRESLVNRLDIKFDYDQEADKQNSYASRIALLEMPSGLLPLFPF